MPFDAAVTSTRDAGHKEEHVINMLQKSRLIALFAILAVFAAACGSDSGTETTGADSEDPAMAESDPAMAESDPAMSEDSDAGSTSTGGETLDSFDLGGQTITVGSKDFTEQLILGEVMVLALDAAGAETTDATNTGGTSVARSALVSGDIDVYPEYNGTGWTVHLGREEPSFDSAELTEDVRTADLEENDIVWVSQAPFNDTYGFAAGPDFVEENGELDLQGMADYLAENSDATVCMESEFPSRPDGLVLFEDATGYELPQDQTNIIETNLIYTETANGNCTFGEIFTTDGRIPELGLDIIDDDGVFIIYNVSATMRNDAYMENPDAFDQIFDMVFAPLDEETMAELNRRVSVDGEDASAVAESYLTDQGLL